LGYDLKSKEQLEIFKEKKSIEEMKWENVRKYLEI
jgi:hypothetical protein